MKEPIFKKVRIDEIKPNSYNPNEMVESMMDFLTENIKVNGFLQPILINQDNIIIDGEHRWKAAKIAGIKEIPVIQIEQQEKESKFGTINMNQIKGDLNPIKFAELLKSLKEEYPVDTIAEYLNLPVAEIELYDELLDLPDFIVGELPMEKIFEVTCPKCGHSFEVN